MSLPARPVDGQLSQIKLGEGLTTTYIRLRWNATRERWVGNEWSAIRSTDQIGVALTNEPFTVKQYIPLNNSPTYANDFASFARVGEAFAAGLTMEYRHSAWCAGHGSKVSVGTYFYELNSGDFNTPSGKSNAEENYTTPPTKGWAETNYLQGASTEIAVRKWVSSGWETLNAPAGGIAVAKKTAIYPASYAFMGVSPTGSALVFDYALQLRFVL